MSHPFATRAYAEVFGGLAAPLWTEAWGAHVLTRPLPGGDGRDASGLYPLAVFTPGADLAAGLEFLKAQGLVSVGLVPDPATAPPVDALRDAFDLCAPFKTHWLVDYDREVRFSKHHRYEVKKATSQLTVAVVELRDHLDAWCGLYRTLGERHTLGGFSALSDDAFARLAQVAGLTTVAAFAEGEAVSMHLWVEDAASRSAISLFAATSAEGYRRSAPYAVYDLAIRHFAHLRTLNLGAGAGLTGVDDGLSRFKRGFANAEVQAWFCGAILDPDRYAALSGGAAAASIPFPAYRHPAGPAEAVSLRPLVPSDLPLLHGWYQTPELWEHLVGDFVPRGEAEAIAYMQRWLSPAPDEVRFGIELQAGSQTRLIGAATLSPVDRAAGWAELHVMIGEAADRGGGRGRRAVSALLDHGFGELDLARIQLHVLATNAAARAVYERLGFVAVGEGPTVLKNGQSTKVLKMEAYRPASATT